MNHHMTYVPTYPKTRYVHCPKCESMKGPRYTGASQPMSPPRYGHECDDCGNVFWCEAITRTVVWSETP